MTPGAGTDDQPRFDPRHDPMFQRGFRPGEHDRAEHSRADPHSRAAANAHGRADAAAPVAPTSSVTPVASASSASPSSPVSPPVENVENVENVEDRWATDAAPRRNPFLTALWVIGPALIVGGLWLAWRAMSNQNSNGYNGVGEMPFEMVLQQITWTLAPSMISTGFLTIIGLIFERAFRWQRARRAAS